ncbi:signal peptidase I [Planomonospora sp. ID91781]|uniref:signal peptidase I n=1 Tax=Planomonospora sp. ID91781 TaxID=2738135 RepID=UPI0018C35943|nr:signal peptidase I [Planomonospora sp. ID91781]MBG0819799.1 signal peptidase I [Planomonospora sp. ID91781]
MNLYGKIIPTALLLVATTCGCGVVLDRVIPSAPERHAYIMAGDAMAPTIEKDDRVAVRMVDGDYVPAAGDIVVFDARSWGLDGSFVHRVTGVPGSTVECCDAKGRQVVDGVPAEEDYLAGSPGRGLFEVVVPPGRLWVQGDNRETALDSRAHMGDPSGGTIAVSDVIGVVELDGSQQK